MAYFEPGRHHAIWKEWSRIGRGREERFFLEHRPAVLESLQSGLHAPEQVLLSRELQAQDPRFWDDLVNRTPESRWFLLDGGDLDRVISVPHCGGLCGVYSPRPCNFQELCRSNLVLVGWELGDPGNLGTLIRAGHALVGAGVLSLGGCSPWSAKVARASAGSLLTSLVHSVARSEEGVAVLQRLVEMDFSLYAAVPRGGTLLSQVEWTGRDAVLLGNEARGLPPEVVDLAQGLTIPGTGRVESLNVAMSATVITWEWGRVRQIFDS